MARRRIVLGTATAWMALTGCATVYSARIEAVAPVADRLIGEDTGMHADRYERFQDVRRRHDPHGKFDNAYVDRVLGRTD